MKLGNKPYYIKKHNCGKIEFKCCPKKFIIQCIKFYENKKIQEEDLMFLDEGYIASYLKPIFN